MKISAVDLVLVTEIFAGILLLVCLFAWLLRKRNKELKLSKARHRRVVDSLDELQSQWQVVNQELLTAQQKIAELENELLDQSFEQKVSNEDNAALHDELNRLKEIEERFLSSKAELDRDKQELERLQKALAESDENYTRETEKLQKSLKHLEDERQALMDELAQLRGDAPSSIHTENGNGISDDIAFGTFDNTQSIHSKYKLEIAELQETCAKQAFTISQLSNGVDPGDFNESDLVVAKGKIANLESQLSQSEACIGMLEEELDAVRVAMKNGSHPSGEEGVVDNDSSDELVDVSLLDEDSDQALEEMDSNQVKDLYTQQRQTILRLEKALEAANSESELVVAKNSVASLESQLSQSEACINMLEEELDALKASIGNGQLDQSGSGEEGEFEKDDLERAELAQDLPEPETLVEGLIDEPAVLSEVSALPDDVLAISSKVGLQDVVESIPVDDGGVVEVEDRISIEEFKLAADTSEDLNAVASSVIDAVAAIGLSACLKVQGVNELVTKSTEGEVWPDDLQKLSGDIPMGGKDADPELLISTGKLVLLIKDMPLYDPIRCMEIKDNISEAMQIAAEVAEMIDSYGIANST